MTKKKSVKVAETVVVPKVVTTESLAQAYKITCNFVTEDKPRSVTEQLDAIRKQVEASLDGQGVQTLLGGMLLVVGVNGEGKATIYPVYLKETGVGIAIDMLRKITDAINKAPLMGALKTTVQTTTSLWTLAEPANPK